MRDVSLFQLYRPLIQVATVLTRDSPVVPFLHLNVVRDRSIFLLTYHPVLKMVQGIIPVQAAVTVFGVRGGARPVSCERAVWPRSDLVQCLVGVPLKIGDFVEHFLWIDVHWVPTCGGAV